MGQTLVFLAALCVAFSMIGQDVGEGAHDEVVLKLPDRAWGLRVHPPGFEFDRPHVVREGRAAWAAGDSLQPGLMVELVMEHAPEVTDVTECVSRFERRLDLDSNAVSELRRYQLDGRPVIEYDIRKHRGAEIKQRNLHGYFFHDHTCTEMHVSFVGYSGDPRAALERVIRSVEIVDDAEPERP